MKKIFLLLVVSVFVMTPNIYADYIHDVEQIKKYNPDGHKYQFMKSYINSLEYVKKNDDRRPEDIEISFDDANVFDKVTELKDYLIFDNANWRVARNLMKKYKQSENGMMLLVSDKFVKACNAKIALNQKERADLDGFLTAYENNDLDVFDRKTFVQNRDQYAREHKSISTQMLEASLLAAKVMVSDKTNYYGEIGSLGITEDERRKLLRSLDEFYGEGYQGEMREGQTYLEASVAALREVLEDYSWDTLDG